MTIGMEYYKLGREIVDETLHGLGALLSVLADPLEFEEDYEDESDENYTHLDDDQIADRLLIQGYGMIRQFTEPLGLLFR